MWRCSMAVSMQQPLVLPGQYDSVFKVDVMLHAPLRCCKKSLSDVKVDLMMLSLQLDTLCKQDLGQKKVLSIYGNKIQLIGKNIQELLHLCSHLPAFLVFSQLGLAELFPHTAAFLRQLNVLDVVCSESSMNKYFNQVSSLHHILFLSRQIHHDVANQVRLKYLAHQLAALYHGINCILSQDQTLHRLKQNIEDNFKSIKEFMAEVLEDEEVMLTSEITEWVLELTDSITQVISRMPKSITDDVLPFALIL
ncbi:uncharacterized protein LOC131946622 isoform X1 [Physella acuta]|uniref:uncharacterized protein LOC131946622 isoform X1 n=2 Tax=Physella acuta TaxID=109671 RepID=UPI0027DBF5CE|nr:uncharacterized protein LOC131946622 isoform X1 [Physella acuta]XP_059163540.1 uncharacterized protein LOC131946622 isoform X1 [Physella acuta]XP_059163549.1 uncharacterized protein LOC131946622 isoform X1 [Physella acuta]XP_059163558.1 uncharacterized protein LOC131946622 isoform X1 [Physella acuta]